MFAGKALPLSHAQLCTRECLMRRVKRPGPKAEHAMTKYLMMLMMLLSLAAVNVGCEADADVDDDGGKIKVDVDD
jgi:hypothetical protein